MISFEFWWCSVALLLIANSVTASKLAEAEIEQDGNTWRPMHNAEAGCKACVLFAQCLHKEIQKSQPPTRSHLQDKKRFLQNEDRIDAVLSAALHSAANEYIFVDNAVPISLSLLGNPDEIKPWRGYWPIQLALEKLNVTEEEHRTLTEKLETGAHDADMDDFLKFVVLGGNAEEEIEGYIAKNTFAESTNSATSRVGDDASSSWRYPSTMLLSLLAEHMCASHCSGEVSSEMYPSSLFDADPRLLL